MKMMIRCALAALLLCGCVAPSGGNLASGVSTKALDEKAHDKIMWVSDNPATFGRYRMLMHCQQYPSFQTFVRKHGEPEYMAETNSKGRHIWIVYYPEKSEAYACKTERRMRGQVLYSGPYPITKNERAMLERILPKAAH